MEKVRELVGDEVGKTLLLADTTSSHDTATQAKLWLDRIIEAAQKEMHFLQVVEEFDLPEGHKDLLVPTGSWISSWSSSASEGAAVNYTTMDTISGVTFTPADANYGIAISNRALRVNRINLINEARKQLTYRYRDVIDQAIKTAIEGATAADADTAGMQVLYGGDASDAVDVAAGDILTPELIKKAKRLLMSTACWYWNSGTFTKSSATKNPWRPTNDEPFVLFISPENWESLANDTQFTNAAEFGNNDPVLNGKIAKYVGVNIVVTDNLTAKSSSDTGWSTDGHVCYMVKAKKCAGLAWGQRPRIQVVDFPSELEKRIILEMAYQAKVLYDDAIVQINVADE